MPHDKRTKIKEPIGKKSERKALRVETRRAKKGLEELCDIMGVLTCYCMHGHAYILGQTHTYMLVHTHTLSREL